MGHETILNRERVSELFEYHPDGYLVNKVDRGRCAKAGKRAGRGRPKSYRQVRVDGKPYREHQLVWLLFNGSMPKLVDHIDHNKYNNRIENLREISHKENIRHGSGRQAGITNYLSTGRFIARITINDRTKHLGIFDTYEEALAARKRAEEEDWI